MAKKNIVKVIATRTGLALYNREKKSVFPLKEEYTDQDLKREIDSYIVQSFAEGKDERISVIFMKAVENLIGISFYKGRDIIQEYSDKPYTVQESEYFHLYRVYISENPKMKERFERARKANQYIKKENSSAYARYEKEQISLNLARKAKKREHFRNGRCRVD